MFPVIEKVMSWTIPLNGNKRIFPYAMLLVNDGKMKKVIRTKEDKIGSYIIVNRKRYRIRNNGGLYNLILEVADY